MLTELDSFLKRTEPEIEGITGEERDTTSFMRMMRLFNEVRTVKVVCFTCSFFVELNKHYVRYSLYERSSDMNFTTILKSNRYETQLAY